MIQLRPGDSYYEVLFLSSTAGAAVEADGSGADITLQTATNGTDDGTTWISATLVTSGTVQPYYKLMGTVPTNKAIGAILNVRAMATVGGTIAGARIDTIQVVAWRPGIDGLVYGFSVDPLSFSGSADVTGSGFDGATNPPTYVLYGTVTGADGTLVLSPGITVPMTGSYGGSFEVLLSWTNTSSTYLLTRTGPELGYAYRYVSGGSFTDSGPDSTGWTEYGGNALGVTTPYVASAGNYLSVAQQTELAAAAAISPPSAGTIAAAVAAAVPTDASIKLDMASQLPSSGNYLSSGQQSQLAAAAEGGGGGGGLSAQQVRDALDRTATAGGASIDAQLAALAAALAAAPIVVTRLIQPSGALSVVAGCDYQDGDGISWQFGIPSSFTPNLSGCTPTLQIASLVRGVPQAPPVLTVNGTVKSGSYTINGQSYTTILDFQPTAVQTAELTDWLPNAYQYQILGVYSNRTIPIGAPAPCNALW
jgi:hypothetical protein